jgi:TetR/AcrR family transcriptional repressor of nem operon
LVAGTGLGRSSLYNAFGSKHGLYEQALRRYSAITTSNIALVSEPGPVRERIRCLLVRIAEDELRDVERNGCMMANATLELAGRDEIVADIVAQNFLRLENALASVLKRAQENGEIGADREPRALARFFVSTIQGLRVYGKGSPPQGRRQRLHDVIEVAIGAMEGVP